MQLRKDTPAEQMLPQKTRYEDALTQIQRGINNANQTQAGVNEGYLYYLLGLSRMAVVMRAGGCFDERDAEEIYENFDMALRMDSRAAYQQTMKNKTRIIAGKSGVPVDEKYKELTYLLR